MRRYGVNYFKTKDEIEGTDWHEFYRGKWDSKFWSDSSLYIDDDTMRDSGLGRLLREQIPGYSKYGISVVSAEQWERILTSAEGDTAQVIAEAAQWALDALEECGYFTILGL